MGRLAQAAGEVADGGPGPGGAQEAFGDALSDTPQLSVSSAVARRLDSIFESLFQLNCSVLF